MKDLLALQLYSLRRETATDAEATVRRVPSLGFDGIELAGTYGWSIEKWKAILADTKLVVVGAHAGLEVLEKDWAAQIAFQKAVGNARLVVPWLSEECRTPDGYRKAAGLLNALGRRARAESIELFYHNHAFEFEALAGATCGMDILLHETEPALVKFEIDTYWVERGGRNAWQFIHQHSARIGMIHAKELRKKDQADVPAGQGDVDFKSIVPFARQQNWPIVVEFEGEDAPAAVAESAKYLSGL